MDYQVQFNLLKHHLIYIKSYIKNYNQSLVTLKSQLAIIGDSQMDVYIGQLLPKNIYHEIYQQLSKKELNQETYYKKWIELNGGYQVIKLSDGSNWVLRYTGNTSSFIHLHPGRYSPHTFRVKANHLKTAIGLHIFLQQKHSELNIETVNHIRSEYLKLSPIKRIVDNKGLSKIIVLTG